MKINGTVYTATHISVALDGSMTFQLPRNEVSLEYLPELLTDATIETADAVYYGKTLERVTFLPMAYEVLLRANFVGDDTVANLQADIEANAEAIMELAEIIGGESEEE